MPVLQNTSKDIIENPCTKVQYKITNSHYSGKYPDNIVYFKLTFVSPEMKVFEEYLIFDFVAMISAIGGTLGLCTGFSFSGVTGTMLNLSEKLGEHIANLKSKKKAHNNKIDTSIIDVCPLTKTETSQTKSLSEELAKAISEFRDHIAKHELRILSLERKI